MSPEPEVMLEPRIAFGVPIELKYNPIDILTQEAPKLAHDELLPVPTISLHKATMVGHWVWIIAGRQICSSFSVELGAAPAEISRRAEEAHRTLIYYVQEILDAALAAQQGTRSTPSVVAEGGEMPCPVQKESECQTTNS